MNIGASSTGSSKNYYAWGETSTKQEYTSNNYKFISSSTKKITKYCTQSIYGTVDNLTTLEMIDDAAHVNWGGDWRMPTLDEARELINNCTWTYTNGGYYIVTGPNGKKIRLPVCGYYDGSANVAETSISIECYYWTSTLLTGTGTRIQYNGGAYCFGPSVTTLSRPFGLPVRPVHP